jgi:hypothetical protein
MITIIHGENITESRKKLDEVLVNKTNIKRLDGKGATGEVVQLLFESGELFAVSKTIVIENYKAVPKTVQEKIVTLVEKSRDEVIVWQNGNLDKRLINKFAKAQVFDFPLPKYYFVFLDTLAPRQGIRLHELYEKLQSSFAPEQILFSILKRMHQMLILQTGREHEFEEMAKMNSWQLGKLRSQLRLWNEQGMKNFYQQAFSLEKKLKTSELPTDLAKSIDILLLTEL